MAKKLKKSINGKFVKFSIKGAILSSTDNYVQLLVWDKKTNGEVVDIPKHLLSKDLRKRLR